MTEIKLADFARVPPGAAMDKSLSKAALKVLIALCGHANPKNLAWPSQSKIAAKSALSRQRVNAALQELCNRKWIILLEQRNNPCKWSPNLYLINFDRPLDDIMPTTRRQQRDDTDSVNPATTLVGHPTGDTNKYINKKKEQSGQSTILNAKSPYLALTDTLISLGVSIEEAGHLVVNLPDSEYETFCREYRDNRGNKQFLFNFLSAHLPSTILQSDSQKT